jgi:hypothetical protein
MQVPPLNQLFIFRIEHKANLPYILEHGMHIRGHAAINPNHVFIGNAQLTAVRHTIPVRPGDVTATLAQQYGDLGDYVPFYFGPCSPMLFAIKKGSEGVMPRPQHDIVYLCCRFNSVVNSGKRYAFTDGHAKMALTEFYSSPAHLANLHWDTIYSRFWFNTEAEFDRARRKQAEMLVHSHVPPEWIEAVVVYNDEVRTFAQAEIDRLNHPAAIRVHSPTLNYNNCPFYYP